MTSSLVRGSAFIFASFALFAGAEAFAQPAAVTQHQERVREETAPAIEDVTDWNLAAGAVANTGNTSAFTLNGGTDLRVVRGRHSVEGASLASYARGRVDVGGMLERRTTARNLNSRFRYDFGVTTNDALFVALRHRWDTFAGLDSRLQTQAGYLRYFHRAENHRAWGEIGYDFTWDDLDPDPFPDPADPTMTLTNTVYTHAARLFLGYENKLNEHVHFRTGLEGLLNLQVADDVRLNWDLVLKSVLSERFQLELKFLMLFDNVPVPGRKEVDTTTTANLIVSIF